MGAQLLCRPQDGLSRQTEHGRDLQLGDLVAAHCIGQVQNGEDVNVEERFAALKEKYPDLAESVDMYLEMYKALGAESLAAMLTPAE